MSHRLFYLLLAALLAAGEGEAQGRRPNIIFILSDDHAYQAISAYGSRLAQTPNIDRIAREGAVFTRALVTNSICGPSRATLLTGKYSHMNGYTLNEKKFNTDQFLFPALLQQNGYQTAWVGKWHLGSLPKGFDHWQILNGQGEYYNPDFISEPHDTTRMEGYVTNIITNLSEDWLDRRDTAKPFCLVIGERSDRTQDYHQSADLEYRLGAYPAGHCRRKTSCGGPRQVFSAFADTRGASILEKGHVLSLL